MLQKQENIGITGNEFKWFESFFRHEETMYELQGSLFEGNDSSNRATTRQTIKCVFIFNIIHKRYNGLH